MGTSVEILGTSKAQKKYCVAISEKFSANKLFSEGYAYDRVECVRDLYCFGGYLEICIGRMHDGKLCLVSGG